MPGSVFTGVAGSLPFGVTYLLDGAPHNNLHDNLGMPLPFPDALQEFRVATSGLSAENGVHSGATVNAVTKSGRTVLDAVRVPARQAVQRQAGLRARQSRHRRAAG